MAITVGTDTYITVAEADAYLAEHYVSTDARLTAWDALSDADKEIYLRNATRSIDSVKYSGRPKDREQALKFPRCYSDDTAYYADPDYPYVDWEWYHGEYCQADVPDAVKDAQAEEALELASPSRDTTLYNRRLDGVKSRSIGHFSESYGNNYSGGVKLNVRSTRAQQLMAAFIGGSFRVC